MRTRRASSMHHWGVRIREGEGKEAKQLQAAGTLTVAAKLMQKHFPFIMVQQSWTASKGRDRDREVTTRHPSSGSPNLAPDLAKHSHIPVYVVSRQGDKSDRQYILSLRVNVNSCRRIHNGSQLRVQPVDRSPENQSVRHKVRAAPPKGRGKRKYKAADHASSFVSLLVFCVSTRFLGTSTSG